MKLLCQKLFLAPLEMSDQSQAKVPLAAVLGDAGSRQDKSRFANPGQLCLQIKGRRNQKDKPVKRGNGNLISVSVGDEQWQGVGTG